MANSIRHTTESDPVRTLDNIRPTTAKAGLRSDRIGPASDLVGPAVGDVIAEAVVSHYGSVKAASISLGQNGHPLDASLMMREFKKGNLARLDRDAEAKAFVSRALDEAFATGDPKARLRRLIREARQRLDEIAESIAS